MELRDNIHNEIIEAVRGKQDDKSMLDNIMKLIESEKVVTVAPYCKKDSELLRSSCSWCNGNNDTRI